MIQSCECVILPLLHTKAGSVLAECNLSLSEKRSGVKVEWGEIEVKCCVGMQKVV